MAAIGDPSANWRRACMRGSVFGMVAAAHLALLLAMLIPAKPRPRATRTPHRHTGALQVELLTSGTTRVARAAAALHLARTPPPRRRATPRQNREPRTTTALQASLMPAPAVTAAAPPAFIAGGGFSARLQSAGVPPPTPRLPGGHHYLASDFAFIPVQQQSLEGKVHKVAALLFGGFDPACKNAELELTKTRSQQIADGYTPEDLARIVRKHCQR